jgi:hypothetical protein
MRGMEMRRRRGARVRDGMMSFIVIVGGEEGLFEEVDDNAALGILRTKVSLYENLGKNVGSVYTRRVEMLCIDYTSWPAEMAPSERYNTCHSIK